MGRIQGLELQFNLVQKHLQSKEDCVIIALHCLLINKGLLCVGIEDDWPEEQAQQKGSELMPSGWNVNQDVYSLRYINSGFNRRYLLKVVKAGHTMHVNVALDENTSATMAAKVSQTIADDFSDYSKAYLDLDLLTESFEKNIWEKIHAKASSSNPNSAKKETKQYPPLNREMPPASVNPRPSMPQADPSPIRPFYPRIGGQDLDPFRIGGGGMLFDPNSMGPSRPSFEDFGIGGRGGLPRGSVPPGARFDPIGPPMPGGFRPNPDPDHFRPPDFDDAFM